MTDNKGDKASEVKKVDSEQAKKGRGRPSKKDKKLLEETESMKSCLNKGK